MSRTAAPVTAPRLDAEGRDPEFDPLRDRLLVGARVRTMDADRPTAEAIAVRGGRILAVGTEPEVRATVGPGVQTIDLDGAVVLPGFHDAHVHLTYHGRELSQIRLDDTDTVEEALARIRARAEELPEGRWIQGSGFALQRWELPHPDRRLLDEAAPRHPVLLKSQDHHSGWANGLALERAGIHAGTPDPEGGSLPRREDGSPTGHLIERAVELVARAVPEPTPEAFRAALDDAGRDLASLGVTTVHHMAYEPASHWRALATAAGDDAFPLRVWACVPHQDIESAAALGLATGQGGDRFTVGGAKFFVDGALGSLSAWMLEPYLGSEDRGLTLDGPDVLRERVPAAIAAGLVPVAHAIGDAAVRALLEVYEATAPEWRAAGLRPRLEHAQHVHPDDVARIGALRLVASMQPLHLTFDGPSIRHVLHDREDRAYPLASLARAGAILAFGSDTPIAKPHVVDSLRAAVNRVGMDGAVVGAHEALPIEAALHAYTTGGAAAIGREGRSGVLRRGADADLVVLTRDPFEDLGEALTIGATMSAGRFTFA